MSADLRGKLDAALGRRFGDAPPAPADLGGLDALARIAGRGVCRAYADRPVDPALLRLLCALALSAPTKSDLQQRDIVIVADPDIRRRADELAGGDPWIATAPSFLFFLANNRRQRQVHGWRGKPFANDHLDAFFNASVDAAIALATFVIAAETVGLGCCPISQVRNRAQEVSDLLGLPDHVFPVAGLTVGWPARPSVVSVRLPLAATVHTDRFDESRIEAMVDAYDRRREGLQPYAKQRDPARFGTVPAYGWSEDKARQYARAERADFGAFVRRKGFRLD